MTYPDVTIKNMYVKDQVRGMPDLTILTENCIFFNYQVYADKAVFTPQPMTARGIVMSMTDGRAGGQFCSSHSSASRIQNLFKSLPSIADIIYLCMVMLI